MDLTWQHTLTAAQDLLAVLAHAWMTPVEVWLPVATSTLFFYWIIRFVAAVVPIIFRRRDNAKPFKVLVKFFDESDTIYMNTVTMDKVFKVGVRPEVVELKGTGRRMRVNLARRNRNTLKDNWIELNTELFHRLFPDQEVPEPTMDLNAAVVAKCLELEIRKFAANGISGFWFEPNQRLRFQNRFAVYLSVGLMVFQLILGFSFKG
tara:strand:+ start:1045 stop:1662 length:618 start_codon:yes stop_codon:yes gene_type:complete